MVSLLERAGFEVVEQVGEGSCLPALVRRYEPDLVIVDIRMPPSHTVEGLAAAHAIREQSPGTAILVLSAYVEVEHAVELLASGQGVGYLLKSRVTDMQEFAGTVERIAKGASVVDPALVHELVTARRRDDPLAVLSARGTGGARAHGGGPVERRHRPRAVGHRGYRRKARPQHPRQVAAARVVGRAPPGTGGHRVPQRPLEFGSVWWIRSCTARADRSALPRNPTAGLAATRSAKSSP